MAGMICVDPRVRSADPLGEEDDTINLKRKII